MGKKLKRSRREASSSSQSRQSSSSDEIEKCARPKARRKYRNKEVPYAGSGGDLSTPEARRKDLNKEGNMIELMPENLKVYIRKQFEQLTETITESTNQMNRKLKKLTKSVTKLHAQLELHINGSSGDVPPDPRSEPNQLVQRPRYRLEFTCKVKDEFQKGEMVQTHNHDGMISVVLYDGDNRIDRNEPLASAKVKLVVVKGKFNEHGGLRCWSRQQFKDNIVNPGVEPIVSGELFELDGGAGSNSTVKILKNSSNAKFRLGVMVQQETENERVLEGLSNPFFVRGHDRKRKQSDLVGHGQELNGVMHAMPNQSRQAITPFRFNPGPPLHAMPPAEALTTYMLSQHDAQGGQTPTTIDAVPPPGICQDQPRYNNMPLSLSCMQMADTLRYLRRSTGQQPSSSSQFHNHTPAGDLYTGDNTMAQDPTFNLDDRLNNNFHGTQFNTNYRANPMQLVWERPMVDPSKTWNLLDHLMPLYSSQPKIRCGDLPTMRLMTEHYGSLAAIIPKAVMQTRRNRGVLMQSLEPDDSDERRSPKRELQSKYRLRFVNNVREAYYTGENIKADDGNLLKVGLYDENNMSKITSGPLSSASVEVVVLHGDFNDDGQDDWTPEEFNSSVVCPQTQNEEPALGGDRILALVDGEASLGDAFFQITSIRDRTGMFKMGVMLAGTQDERVQQGISAPFLVRNRRGKGIKVIRKPLLAGGVCQITNINSNGDYHEALLSHGIHTVRDFMKHLVMDEQKLRSFLPDVSNFIWEDIINHARRTDIGNQLYSYNCPDQDVVLFFNSIYQLVGAKSGRHYKGVTDFTPFEEALVEKFKLAAYENKESMKYDHMMVANRPVTLYENKDSMHCEGLSSASIPGSKITVAKSFFLTETVPDLGLN